MGFIRAIFGFIIAIALVAFAVANRQSIPLNYSPVHESIDLPLYLLALLFMAVGFMFGALTIWMNAAPTRRVRRQQRKTIKSLEKELAGLQTKQANADAPPKSELFPALPSAAEKNTTLPKAQNSAIKQG